MDPTLEVARNACIDTINNFAMKHYLSNCQDIRACPTTDCMYSGFFDEDDLLLCRQPLECRVCNKTWHDKL